MALGRTDNVRDLGHSTRILGSIFVKATGPDAAEEVKSATLAGGLTVASNSARVKAAPQTPQLHKTCDVACPLAPIGDCHFLESSLPHVGQHFFMLFLSSWGARLPFRSYPQQGWLLRTSPDAVVKPS
jgi:hypothetical protein